MHLSTAIHHLARGREHPAKIVTRHILIGAGLIFTLLIALAVIASLSSPRFEDDWSGKGDSFVNGRAQGGVPLANNFRDRDYFPNIGSYADGSGMCVMTSIEQTGLWLGLEQLRGLRNWCARQPGGGYPQKVDQQLRAYFKAKNIEPLDYIQIEGNRATIAKFLQRCSDTHRCAAITYGYSPRYSGRIAHMIVCPHFDGKRWGVAMDNNLIGGLSRPDHMFEWMQPDELLNRICSPSGEGWLFAWTAPGPPQWLDQDPSGERCEWVGPYYTRFGAEDRARDLRRNGWRCTVVYVDRPRPVWWIRACN